uniref:Uncharacterized protein n=1 Tax=Cryptomonas curvata TaxID=233186 RepID=A0A7S0M9P2_9CRYP
MISPLESFSLMPLGFVLNKAFSPGQSRKGVLATFKIIRRPRAVASMCICINCKLVDRCKAYRFVEEKHSQPFISQDPDFMPRDGTPKIQVFIRKETDAAKGESAASPLGMTVEYDVFECDDFVADQGRWARIMPPGTLLAAGLPPDFVPT